MDSLRISDADRETAVDLLSEQYSVGRLTKDEFDERSDAVWSARTAGRPRPGLRRPPGPLPGADRGPPARGRAPSDGPRAGGRSRCRRSLFLLIALTVLTHLPFVLLGLVAVVRARAPPRRRPPLARRTGRRRDQP